MMDSLRHKNAVGRSRNVYSSFDVDSAGIHVNALTLLPVGATLMPSPCR
ncbi:MAG: hypothetical protein LBN41_02045 [Enterobacteriaceae bacterium]|nr:hypothetical protein [Enterobacteriaceae bacterium]